MNHVRIQDRRPRERIDLAFPLRIKDHFRVRPLRWHMAAWLLVGIVLGLLMTPNFQAPALVAFLVSGVFICSLLGLMTYPVSDHFLWTVAGSGIGLLISPLLARISNASVHSDLLAESGLIAGALMGATSLIWLLPIRMAYRTLFTSQSN